MPYYIAEGRAKLKSHDYLQELEERFSFIRDRSETG